ncbi:hypothetical protein B9Z55_004909 [Caenorhabditis nigoni]|uniref:Uncharacterized protein n=1 Tax=Caenorhabditis nigoni TaxID=1611254 RepID=A0A2G5UYJ9_9PELO|nr:hypothetical protein B9Z55_004909 [Caenorhabditis nigoni]
MRSFLALFLMFLCSPIWVLVEVKSLYTCLHNFYCSNVAFWHVAVLSMPLYAPIIRNQPNCLWPVFLYFVLLPIFVGWAFEIPRRYKPKVQKLSHIILGLFGEILVVWIMLGCTLAIQMHYYSEIAATVYVLSIFLLALSYVLFTNYESEVYIRLPDHQKSFSGIRIHVVAFGIFHLLVAVAIINITIIWPICCLFVISSFFFSIDAYSCLFTDSYSLCVHRESEEEMLRKNPINGIICNVAIRSKYSKKEKLLPDGYQFDDELNFLSLLNMV